MEKCPLCGGEFEGILEHLSIVENVRSVEDLQQRIKTDEEAEKKRNDFNKYIDELNEKLSRKEIDAKKYRELTDKWWSK